MSPARTRTVRWIAVAALIAPQYVHADEPWTEVGVTAVVGGGVTGATGESMRGAGVGLLWTVRVAVGSRRPLAVELGYLGTATDAAQGTLSTSIAEAALRVQPWPRAMWSPYAFAGVGLQHAELVATAMAIGEPGLAAHSLAVPLRAGVQLRDTHGLVVDVRAAFRGGASDAWEASTAVGLEF
jgi:hypothetical protein